MTVQEIVNNTIKNAKVSLELFSLRTRLTCARLAVGFTEIFRGIHGGWPNTSDCPPITKVSVDNENQRIMLEWRDESRLDLTFGEFERFLSITFFLPRDILVTRIDVDSENDGILVTAFSSTGRSDQGFHVTHHTRQANIERIRAQYRG